MIPLDILENFRGWFAERGLKGIFDWIAERGLRLQEFTALLGVDGDGSGLKPLLAEHDRAEHSLYAEVPGLHNLRWILFTPELKNPRADRSEVDAEPASAPVRALILSFVFEGDAEDALAALLERAPVEPILRQCRGFGMGDDPAKYLMKHRIESGYMFRDLGPLRSSDRYMPDATIAEIAEARIVEQEFEKFYSAHSSPRELRKEFLKRFGKEVREPGDPLAQRDLDQKPLAYRDPPTRGFAFPLTRFERRLPDEARWARRASELISRLQDQAERLDPWKKRRRGVHAKAHGLIEATFEVLGPAELPPKYRVGILANPGEQFVAHVRPSNGAHMVQSDRARDARGLAIALEVPTRSKEEFLELPGDLQTARQDFVLMSHPTFFAPDIRHLAVLMSILSAKSTTAKLSRALAFALGSASFRQLAIAGRTFARRVTHPLAAEFHSTTPYLLGDDYIVKYSVELADRKRLDRLGRERAQNFLSDVLRESLGERPIELGFYLHVLSTSVVPDTNRSICDVVEDATLDWKALGAEKVRVATIRIGPQDPTEATRLLRAEEWQFNPWHALAVHRPLGSLNRARRTIYRDSALSRANPRKKSESIPVSGARSIPPGGLSEAAE
jgi:hypothetical protein